MPSAALSHTAGSCHHASRWHLRRAWRHLRAAMLVLLQAWRLQRRHAADRTQLQQMDDRDLVDLGLGRGEIERITRTPVKSHGRR